MNSILKKTLLIPVVAALIFGCSKDKGNYDYININRLKDSVATSIIQRVPSKDSILVEYSPKFTQTIQTNEDNLSFEWQRFEAGNWVTHSRIKKLSFFIKAGLTKPIDFYRLVTTDNSVNIKYYNDLTINYVQPFVKCWFVLQDDNNKSVLGTVENMGSQALVTADAFGRENPGLTIEGKPRFLMVNGMYNSYTLSGTWPFASLYVLTDLGGKFYNSGTLAPVLNYQSFMRQFRVTPSPTKSYCFGQWEAVLDNGELWQQGGATRFYLASMDGILANQSHRFTGAAFIYNAMILFDDLNKRFLYFRNGGNSYSSANYGPESPNTENETKITAVPNVAAFPNKANPAAIGGDKTFLYGGTSYGLFNFEATSLIATYSVTDANKLHVYEFSSNGILYASDAACSGYWPCNPSGLSTSSKFATSFAFQRILFYSSGNKVYKLDLNSSPVNASVIYQHPDAAATITAMRFRAEYNGFSSNDPCYWLGVGIQNTSGEGSLVELHLKTSGDLVAGESIQEYKGFSKIVDLGYNNK